MKKNKNKKYSRTKSSHKDNQSYYYKIGSILMFTLIFSLALILLYNVAQLIK
jgi:hypothetical protein